MIFRQFKKAWDLMLTAYNPYAIINMGGRPDDTLMIFSLGSTTEVHYYSDISRQTWMRCIAYARKHPYTTHRMPYEAMLRTMARLAGKEDPRIAPLRRSNRQLRKQLKELTEKFQSLLKAYESGIAQRTFVLEELIDTSISNLKGLGKSTVIKDVYPAATVITSEPNEEHNACNSWFGHDDAWVQKLSKDQEDFPY